MSRDVLRAMRWPVVVSLLAASAAVGSHLPAAPPRGSAAAEALIANGNGGVDWPAYGALADEQHFSALDQINTGNVARLGLAWSVDLPATDNPMTAPVVVNGVIYMSYGYSVVHAIDGRRLNRVERAVHDHLGKMTA